MATKMKFCVFDTEGSAAEGDYQGCAVYSDIAAEYLLTRDDAISLLREHAEKGYTLAAHNAEYDIMVLLWPANERVSMEYYNHRYSIARWYYAESGKSVLIYDTMGLAANLSIADIGKAVGLEKLPTPQRLLGVDADRWQWRCEKHGVWECEPCYAIRDAEIAYRYLESLQVYCDGYGITHSRKIAGLSVKLWDKLDRHGKVRLLSGELADFARKSYHGGRCEAFRYGTVGETYVYDVKSMYPYVMQNAPMPDVNALEHLRKGPVSESYLAYEGCSDCTVDIPYLAVPVLPVQLSDRLCFPYGRVRGVFTHVELRAAVSRGARVNRIHSTVYARSVVYPFLNYVETLNIQRDEYKRLHDPRELVVKVLMNALYGRLGLRGTQTFDYIEPFDGTKKLHDYAGDIADVIGGRLALRSTKELNRPSPHANVLWASQITAYARVKLLELLDSAQGHLIYCDTDGVYTDAPCLATGDKLGDTQLRGVYQRGTIIGPKLYRLESDTDEHMIRAKGVPRKFAEAYMRDGYAEYSQPGRVLEAFSADVEPSVWRVIHKEGQLVPMKRQLVTPSALDVEGGFSDSVPVWVSLDDDTEPA